MLSIRQTETGWIIERDGTALTVEGVSSWERYEDAVSIVAQLVATQLQAMPEGDDSEGMSADGLLPEAWMSPTDGGIAFQDETGDGRDFTNCDWSWRDPATAFVPLMLQTTTEFGHFGAELAGFVESFTSADGRVGARGRFFDSEIGRQFRDMLRDGRTFSVSVDPGAVAMEDECLEVDDDGWCSDWKLNFLSYQIIGVTGTPFAGFENAMIQLDPATVEAPEPMAASGQTTIGESGPELVIPPVSGEIIPGSVTAASCGCGPTADCGCGSRRPSNVISRLRERPLAAAATVDGVEQVGDVAIPYRPASRFFEDPSFETICPLTITREGRVLSHIALAGSCHTGRLDRCVNPPLHGDYRDFMTNGVVLDDGTRIETGVLTWGIPHADLTLDLIHAQEHYANSRHGWADVVVGQDRFGIWATGVLRPGLSEADIRILRSLSLSGDWRYSRRVGDLSMCAALAVNYPGFPIVASGAIEIPTAMPRVRSIDHQPTALIASGVVRPGHLTADGDVDRRLRDVERILAEPARQQLRTIRRDVEIERLRGH